MQQTCLKSRLGSCFVMVLYCSVFLCGQGIEAEMSMNWCYSCVNPRCVGTENMILDGGSGLYIDKLWDTSGE